MSKEKVKNNQAKPRKKLNVALIVVCGLVLLVLFDMFTPVWGGQVKFYAKWVECGHTPIQGIHNFKKPQSYETAKLVDPFRENRTEYFCTEKQAELAGYSNNSNSYDFPHLTQQERDAM